MVPVVTEPPLRLKVPVAVELPFAAPVVVPIVILVASRVPFPIVKVPVWVVVPVVLEFSPITKVLILASSTLAPVTPVTRSTVPEVPLKLLARLLPTTIAVRS
ncbi:MAG: hypothetical protein ABW223_10930, partial [Rariglobus sp.]